MKFSIIGFIPTLLLLIPVIAACFKTPADKPELEDENIIVFIAKCVGRFGCIGYMSLAIGDYKVGFSSKLLVRYFKCDRAVVDIYCYHISFFNKCDRTAYGCLR